VECHRGQSWAPCCSLCTLQTWSQWLKAIVCHRTYADDTQVYGSCRPAAVDAISSKISECVGAVASFMSLNCDKTEVVWCATSRRQHQLPCSAVSVDSTLVKPVRSACDLGIYRCRPVDVEPCPANGFVVFRRPPPVAPDPSLSADRHVLDTGLVRTRLDYGNSVLAGLPVYLVRRLQSVLNAAARLTYHLRRSDHISDALACLHWLRVPESIEFRITIITDN